MGGLWWLRWGGIEVDAGGRRRSESAKARISPRAQFVAAKLHRTPRTGGHSGFGLTGSPAQLHLTPPHCLLARPQHVRQGSNCSGSGDCAAPSTSPPQSEPHPTPLLARLPARSELSRRLTLSQPGPP